MVKIPPSFNSIFSPDSFDLSSIKLSRSKRSRKFNPSKENSIPATRSKLKNTPILSPKHDCSIITEEYNEEEDPDYQPVVLNDQIEEKAEKVKKIFSKKLPSDAIPRRTRSHLTLENFSLCELEAQLNEVLNNLEEPPNEDNVIIDEEDAEWYKWLYEFKYRESIPPDDPQLEETDEDFRFTYEQEKAAFEDDEEFRSDKGVLVTQKEIQTLLDELEEEELEICVRKSSKNASSLKKNQTVFIDEEDEKCVVAQLQQHVYLLTQFYMLGSFYKDYLNVAKHAKYLLDEIYCFTPDLESETSKEPCKQVIIGKNISEVNSLRLFKKSMVQEALDIVEKWDEMIENPLTPVLYCKSPAIPNTPDADINVASMLKIDNWNQFKFPPLTLKMMAFISMDPFFTVFPSLLPEQGMHLTQHTLSKFSHSMVNLVFTSNDQNEGRKINDNFKKRFTNAENKLLILGYFQYGNQWSKIHENMIPTRTPSRIKARFRFVISSPKNIDFDTRLLLTTGLISNDFLKGKDIATTPRCIEHLPLIRWDNFPPSIPTWVSLLKDETLWQKIIINYKLIYSESERKSILESASKALEDGGYILVPHRCLLSRTSDLDPQMAIDSSCYENHANSITDTQSHIPQDDFELKVLSQLNEIKHYQCLRVKTDSLNLSTYFSHVILDLIKEEITNPEEYAEFLVLLHGIKAQDPSEILSKLINYLRKYPNVLKIISFVFGLKNKHHQHRCWMELVQISKNLQELESYLVFNSFNHRKFLFFLSQFSTPLFTKMDVDELIDRFPINFRYFKTLRFTHNSSVPSIFHILQEFVDPNYDDITYEGVDKYCSASNFPKFTELYLAARNSELVDKTTDTEQKHNSSPTEIKHNPEENGNQSSDHSIKA